MATLQIQDVFEPYYAGKQSTQEPDRVRSHQAADAPAPSITDRRDRFDAINRRFGRTRRALASKG